MNQIESGKLESATDRWKEIEQTINGYLERIKIRPKSPDSLIDKCMSMGVEELKTLTSQECGEYSYSLAQYGLFLQKELNYHDSKIKWCEDSINYMVYSSSNPIVLNTFIKVGEKALILAKNNAVLKELLNMQVQARTIFINLNSLSKYLDNMIRVLLGLQQSKRGRYDTRAD